MERTLLEQLWTVFPDVSCKGALGVYGVLPLADRVLQSLFEETFLFLDFCGSIGLASYLGPVLCSLISTWDWANSWCVVVRRRRMTSGWILPKPPGPLWLFIIWGFEYFKRCAPEPNRFLMCRIQMDVSRRAGQGGFHNGGRCPFPGSKISSSLLGQRRACSTMVPFSR